MAFPPSFFSFGFRLFGFRYSALETEGGQIAEETKWCSSAIILH
jgi:hypothetical protein